MRKDKPFYRAMWFYYLIASVLLIAAACFNIYNASIRALMPASFFQFVNNWIFSLILLVLGIMLLIHARHRYRRILGLTRRRQSLAAAAAKKAQDIAWENGRKIVAIGGGTGLAAILRGLKQVTRHCTAVVTVTDDGGSSGRLVNDSDYALPPGDVRNCLAALSPREGTLEKLFNFRFEKPSELKGHCLGNLLLSGLAEIDGDLAKAVQDLSRIFNIQGRVLPVTVEKVTLGAVMEDNHVLWGETTIVNDRRTIKEVFLEPWHVAANEDAIDSIMAADIILLGPGSLYTSIIPNLLVPGITEALHQTPALVYYVANIMTQRGETDGYNLSAHIEAIVNLSPLPFLDGVIVNNKTVSEEMLAKYAEEGAQVVENDLVAVKRLRLKVIALPLAREGAYINHDGDALASFLTAHDGQTLRNTDADKDKRIKRTRQGTGKYERSCDS